MHLRHFQQAATQENGVNDMFYLKKNQEKLINIAIVM